MRLFLAIYPPKEVLDQLRDVLRKFDKQKRNLINIPVDQMHLTLKFLGPEVSEYSKDSLVEKFRALEHKIGPVKIEFSKITFGFEKEINPWILIANIKRTDSLVNLTATVHDLVKDAKFRDTIRFKRRYQYNYHVSLSRMKKTATRSTGKMIEGITKQLKEFTINSFEADKMFLVESIVNNSAPIYRKLDTFML